MTTLSPDQIRSAVRDHYAAVARGEAAQDQADLGQPTANAAPCCGPTCCGPADNSGGGTDDAERYALALGYSPEDIAILATPSAPHPTPPATRHTASAPLSLGCGNPQAIANLREGETVLDLGAGGGFDCFLAARQVGKSGFVIGVDMTPDMVSRARANAAKLGTTNVDFRLGEIEHLPVADASVDVIISNCVINLSPDKSAVLREAYRVLKPGGRLAISDVVATTDIPEAIANDLAAYAGCVSGAAHHSTIRDMLLEAGFSDVSVTIKDENREIVGDWMPGSGAENHVASATIEGVKRV